MTIQRINPGNRLCDATIHNGVAYLAAMADFAAMNAVWDAWLGTAGIGPARATVEARLARPEIKVEIMVTAALKS